MAIPCPKCGTEFDVALFQFQNSILCDKCGSLVTGSPAGNRNLGEQTGEDFKLTLGRLVIEIASIKGKCPVFKTGDRIVIDEGFRINLKETDAVCMHALASLMPFYNALYHGVPALALGLVRPDSPNREIAYIQCPDPCEFTNGGTVIFRVFRDEKEIS